MVGEPLIFNSEVNCFPFAAQLQNRNTEGGFLGMGNTLHAIPWAALTLDTAEKCFRVDIPAQRIKDDPGFDADHWPSMVDQAWGTQLHDYYGRRPYGCPARRASIRLAWKRQRASTTVPSMCDRRLWRRAPLARGAISFAARNSPD